MQNNKTMWNWNKDNNAMLKKRGSKLAKELEDRLAASQRRGKGRKSKAVGILIAVLLVLGGVGIGSPFSFQSSNVQNTPTPSSIYPPLYQQPTINIDSADNNAQSDQLSFGNTTKIDNALAQHTNECGADALGHYDGLTPECKVQQRLVISVYQNEIESIPSLFEIDEQLVLHRNNVDETVQFFLDRDKYPKMISIWINFGRFITGGVIGGNGGLGGGRPGGGGGGGGRSTLPFSPPPLNSEFQAQMDRLTDQLQHGLAVGNPEVIDREVNRLDNEWRDRMNELVDQQASLLAEYDDYHGPHYIHPNWEEHANEDNMRLAHEPLYAQDRAEINELVDGLVEVEVEMTQREVDLLYGFAQHVVAHNQMCLDLVHDLAQQTVAFNEVRYENPWTGVGVQDQQEVPVVEVNTIVSGLGTQSLYVPTNLRDTPQSYMEAIEEKAGYLPPGTLHSESAFLVHDGTVLDNGMTLGDSGVTNESSISINFRGLGGVRPKSKLQTTHSYNRAVAKRQKQMQPSFVTQPQESAEDAGAAATQSQYTDPEDTEFDDEKYDAQLFDVDLSGAAATATTSQSGDDEFNDEKFDTELSDYAACLDQSTSAQQCHVGDTDEFDDDGVTDSYIAGFDQSTLPVSSGQVARVGQPAPHQPATHQAAPEEAISSSPQGAVASHRPASEDADAIAFRQIPFHLHNGSLDVIGQLFDYVDNHFDADIINHHQLALNIILEVADKNPNEELTDAHFFRYAHNHPQAKKYNSYSVANENEKLPPQESSKRTLKPKVSFDSRTEVKLSSDCVFSDADQSECTSHRLSDETQSPMNVDTEQLSPAQPTSTSKHHFRSEKELVKALSLPKGPEAVALRLSSDDSVTDVMMFGKEYITKATVTTDGNEWDTFCVDWSKRLGSYVNERLPDGVLCQLGPRTSTQNKAVFATNYAPETDATDAPELQCGGNGYDNTPHNLSNPKNPCLLEATKNLPSSANRDIQRAYAGVSEHVDIPAVEKINAVVPDMHWFTMATPPAGVSKDWSRKQKQTFLDNQISTNLKAVDNISEDEMFFLSSCIIHKHGISHSLHNNGEAMLMQPFSPTIEKVIKVGDNDVTKTTVFFRVQPRLPHPQASLMQFPLEQYSDERLVRCDKVLLETCNEIGIFDGLDLDFENNDYVITTYQRKAFGALTPEEREERRLAMRQACIDGYEAAVEVVFNADPEACLTYCKTKFPREVQTVDDINFVHKKSYFGSLGYNDAVQSVFGANPEGCLTYCKDKFPGEVKSAEDIKIKHMKSYFSSRGQNAAILSVYKDNKKEAFKYIKNRFPDEVSAPEDITFDQMHSYFGYFIGVDAAAGVIRNHDPDGIFQYFDFTGNGIATLHRDHDVPQLRKLALMYKVELQAEVDAGVCDQITGSMPLTSFIKATERFIAKVDSLTDTDLPEGWTLPSALEYNRHGDHDINMANNINSQMCLVVTPDSAGVKAMTRHLTKLIVKAMEKFDRPVAISREGVSDIIVEYPRFKASCKSRDSSGNPKNENGEQLEGEKFSYSYLVLSKVLLQDPNELSAKFYTCPNCSFRYNLMDTNEFTATKKKCTTKNKGGCNKHRDVEDYEDRPSGGL